MNDKLLRASLLLVATVAIANLFYLSAIRKDLKELSVRQSAAAYISADSPFYYFGGYNTITEAGDEASSNDPYWWLNSGGLFYLSEGVGRTVRGNLPMLSRWRINYSLSNPADTDNGYHPQNIFRLISRKNWKNFTEEAYFKILKNNLSKSPNRNESNGLLLIGHYDDSDNLYYAGIRVDGSAVVKKKVNGEYFTLGYEPIFPGTYDKNNYPSLLPLDKRIGIKLTMQDAGTNKVSISLDIDKEADGNWKNVLNLTDDGKNFGGRVIVNGKAGIRTDFMDVEIDSYKIRES